MIANRHGTQSVEPSPEYLNQRVLKRPCLIGIAGRRIDRRSKRRVWVNRPKLIQSLSRDPQVSTACGSGWAYSQHSRPLITNQLVKQFLPAVPVSFRNSNQPELHQRIMQLVG